MRRHLIWVLAVGAAVVVAVGGTALAGVRPTVVRAGNLLLTISGGVTPEALPKERLAPIGFHGSGTLETVDGSQPPALKGAIFEVDRHIVVDVKGLPVCPVGELESRDTAAAIDACPDAILGKGSGRVRVAFPDQTPFEATGPLVLFNGGVKGGMTTLYVHVYVAVPAPTAIVVPTKITRERKGRYGMRIAVSVPIIAGGSGSVVHSELSAHRYFISEGEKRSWVFARCADGHFVARGTLEFRDGTAISGSVLPPCRATG